VRLLIVEDSELIRKVTHLAFPQREHELIEAANGLEALAVLARTAQPFDAIVLDLQMPDMNGVEFLRALQQRSQHRDTPVVIATSESDASPLLLEARQLGVAAIVKKPWKPQTLAQVVRDSCGGSPSLKGPVKMASGSPLSNADVRLLALAEHGYTFRPADAAEGVFDLLIEHLRQLRERGLVRLDEGRVMKSQRGGYLMAGPCDLTDAGREALERDRRLGPRA